MKSESRDAWGNRPYWRPPLSQVIPLGNIPVYMSECVCVVCVCNQGYKLKLFAFLRNDLPQCTLAILLGGEMKGRKEIRICYGGLPWKGTKASTTQSSFIHMANAKLEEILKNGDVMAPDVFLSISHQNIIWNIRHFSFQIWGYRNCRRNINCSPNRMQVKDWVFRVQSCEESFKWPQASPQCMLASLTSSACS